MNILNRVKFWKKAPEHRQNLENLIAAEKENILEDGCMTEMAREELINRIKGLDAEEMKLVAKTLPVEVCLDRIWDDLRAADVFRKSITECCCELENRK